MIANLFDVRDTEDKGEGLFARLFIPKGTIIGFECQNCKKRTEEDMKKLSKEELDWVLNHEYKDKTGLFFDVCDKTILFLNHSCNSNILGSDRGFDIVVKDIYPMEEATYDYRVFYDDLNMPCNCGEYNCCGIVTCKHPVPKELYYFWSTQINSALKLIDKVEQPLREEIIRQRQDLTDIFL
jgi:hypothetical protein